MMARRTMLFPRVCRWVLLLALLMAQPLHIQPFSLTVPERLRLHPTTGQPRICSVYEAL